MSEETFKSKLVKLIQKSRKALRLYSVAGKESFARKSKPYAEMQIKAWFDANESLLIFLQEVTTKLHLKQVVNEILAYAKKIQSELVLDGKILEDSKSLLVAYSKNQDFVSLHKLSSDLISLKAKFEAKKAVFSELQELLEIANISISDKTSDKSLAQEELAIKESKIIPFRSKKISL